MIINGKDAVLGRLASYTAKKLLAGEEVSIVNAEKVIITGDSVEITKKYLKKRSIGSPQHGPFFPTKPDLIVRRTVRGMLPYKTNKGRIAFKKLRVYIGTPVEMEKGESIAVKTVRTSYMTVGDLATQLGWRK
ncbi:MAG TPA: 50S ribosomal protein L13 [archaeon]|nr:50S ribosomal protein L13 [archaeon]